MDLKTLASAIEQIASEKGIEAAKVLEAAESSIAAAYRKEYGQKGEIVKARLDPKTGRLDFWQVKMAVDKNAVRMKEEAAAAKTAEDEKEHKVGEEPLPLFNPDRHIFLEEARRVKKDVAAGEELEFPLEPPRADFGRIAAQAAKQVILQKIREAERESVAKEFKDKEGQVVSGVVQRFDRGNVYVDLGRAVGVMFYNESVPGEHYRIGERLRFYVLAVQEDNRGAGIVLSRSHPKFVAKLFEMEVPEIAEGIIEIKTIAREPGNRTKIAVASNDERIDPVGSCVGQRGTRVMAVNNELGQEKLDIIEWSEEPEKFIASAMSPAKVKLVEIFPRREAKVLVAEDQLSLAIGRGGQNVRLAAKLTGWKIDVRSQSRPDEVQEGGVAGEETSPETAKSAQSDKTGEPKNSDRQNQNDSS